MLKLCLYCFTANLSLAGLDSEQIQCLPNQKDADSLHIQAQGRNQARHLLANAVYTGN